MSHADTSPRDSSEVAFQLLPNPAAYEQALYRLLNQANRRVSVVMYIFRPDETGKRFLDALVAAAHRGVSVRLIVDAHGSLFTPRNFFEPLIRAHGEVVRFGDKLGPKYLVRLHQKLVAVDDDLAVIGGFNIGNEYFDPPEDADFRELGFQINHAAAGALHRHVERLSAWCTLGGSPFDELRNLLAQASDPSRAVQWLHGGAGMQDSPLLRALEKDLSCATKLDAITAYFAPPKNILGQVKGVAERGCVRLILPGKTDVPFARAAARHFYRRLLASGCELFEYGARPLHAKLTVIDDVVYVGSANIDPRSLFTNIELALRIKCAALAQRARVLITAEIASSRRIARCGPITNAPGPVRLGRALAYAILYRLDDALCRFLVR